MRYSGPSRFLVALIAALAGCGDGKGSAAPGAAPAEGAKPEAAIPAVDPVANFLQSIDAYNENSVESLLATYSDEATWHMPGTSPPPVQGRKRIARQGVAFKTNFPESRFAVRRVLLMGGTLAAQVVFRATRRFDEQGVEVAPREVGYEAIQLVETERGYARRTLVQHDQLGIRRQLGLVAGDPPPVPDLPREPEIVREAATAGFEAVVAELHGAWERGDFAAWKDLVTEDFALVDHATGERFDLARASAWLAGRDEEFDTVLFERYQTVAAGPWVATFFAERVDHRKPGAAQGVPAPRISLHGAHVMRLVGGRIAMLEIYRNQAESLRETGRAKELLP
ncbi:MAG TPA: nuclear transport factor 2 family protein [Phycisphaerae bacterium]|nr:nuclear transport factor 2 family protein [Phycisphaerae bacterium]